jgi:hypothetical protein
MERKFGVNEKVDVTKMIDILIMGSSRPKLLPYCINSIREKVKYSGNFRWIYHEDFVYPEYSQESVNYLISQNFDEVVSHYPAIGYGRAIEHMLDYIKSPFFLMVQEDCEFEREVDLDIVINLMDKYNEINQITYHINKTPRQFKGKGAIYNLKEYEFDNITLTLWYAWLFFPNITRLDWFKKKWVVKPDEPEKFKPADWFTNEVLGNIQDRVKHEYSYNNIGSFIYGKIGEPRYVRHIGDSWRSPHWQLKRKDESKDFGGKEKPLEWHKQNMHPDVKLHPRPSNEIKSRWYPER